MPHFLGVSRDDESFRVLEYGEWWSIGLKQDGDQWVLLLGHTTPGTYHIRGQEEIPIDDGTAGYLIRKANDQDEARQRRRERQNAQEEIQDDD